MHDTPAPCIEKEITISTGRLTRTIVLRLEAAGEDTKASMRPLGWEKWYDGGELFDLLSFEQRDELLLELRNLRGKEVAHV